MAHIDRIIDAFVRSEYFANWQAEHVQAGGYSQNSALRDRYNRCYEAAESGADGSTHREIIDDMRRAFTDYLRYGRRKAYGRQVLFVGRVEAAAIEHLNALELWHDQHGSLNQEVG